MDMEVSGEELSRDARKALDVLEAYISKHKIRKSPERRMLLIKIMGLDSHFTARSLYDMMEGTSRVSLATVYNTLELFQKAGLVVRHPFSEPQYESTSRSMTHHHRICIQCGVIKEFTDQKMDAAIRKRTFTAFAPEHSSLYLYGLCKKCMPKPKGGKAGGAAGEKIRRG